MTEPSCPFCSFSPDLAFYSAGQVVGLWDAFPVSPGHALVIPRRHVASWFETTAEERLALVEGIDAVRDAIRQRYQPDGFNVGVNDGEVAGQTVLHVHVHVIPRYRNDVPDPRGGIRHVIPARGNYLTARALTPWPEVPPPHRRALVRGGDDPLLSHLVAHLAEARGVDVAVAFVVETGLRTLEEHLRDLLGRGGRLRILTGDYLDVTEPSALRRLLDLEGDITCRVFETTPLEPHGRSSFHPKAYIFHADTGIVAFVGSSNLTQQALLHGIEWNYRIVSSRDGAGLTDVVQGFEALFGHPATRPLDHAWIDGYEGRRRLPAPSTLPVAIEPPLPPIEPHEIQREALAALEETRAAGNRAGLVVLATGLGKTYLAALDSNRPAYRRVLFVAHREEILTQAMRAFRRVRPLARLGHYTGVEREPGADVVLASIQTLGRQAHLERFQPEDFDYLVIDEFHHASAPSYRRLLNHFRPRFLLGLTATPERSDGGDLLALCQENLVYRCDLVEGIRRSHLCPFRYFGVPDDVDYSNIPWRSTRFDEEALTRAVATRARAENIMDQYRRRGGARTLAFCVSQRHADFMAEFFTAREVRAVAVHAGERSAPRAASLERLDRGALDIVFAVDMFNEGVDLPNIDTVMMLRPTESRVLWLQQFGRGLRHAAGKTLTVIDYIGNHRTFLLKPQTLFQLGPGDQEVLNALERLQAGTAELPPGCEVTYDLRAIEILKGLLRISADGAAAVQRYYEGFRELHGIRPTAVEAFHDGYAPRALRRSHGSWLRFVAAMGDLAPPQQAILDQHGPLVDALEVTEMTRSYKMLVLLAMLDTDRFPGRIGIGELVAEVTRLATGSARLRTDFGGLLQDPVALQKLLETNPIAAWTGGRGTGGVSYFAYDGQAFATTFASGLSNDGRQALQEVTRELAEWRLAEYLERRLPEDGEREVHCKVSHSGGRPILFLPDRIRYPELPEGWVPVVVDDEAYEANFAKIAVNVLRRPGGEENELPVVLRRWFGPDAGRPGTSQVAVFRERQGRYHLGPAGRRTDQPERWRRFARDEIPPLFGLQFSASRWNSGFVAQGGHLFLLVTLEKGGRDARFQYRDHFVSPDRFQWQSQNRTTQDSEHGQIIRHHRERGVPVHLFVRARSKTPTGAGAPFIYCGEVSFVEWQGERPITVEWQLSEPVPRPLFDLLGVPVAGSPPESPEVEGGGPVP